MSSASRTTITRTTEDSSVEVEPTASGDVRIEFPRGAVPLLDSTLGMVLSAQGAEALGKELVRVARLAGRRR